MSLTPGARLGPYEILSAIGAGGMGEVLDFGLARLAGPAEAGHYVPGGVPGSDRRVRLQPDLTASPTITTPAMTPSLMVVQHWVEELKRLVPTN